MDFFDDVEKPDYEKNVLPTNNDDDDSGSAQESENNNAESSTGEQDTKKVVAEKKKPGPKPKKAAAGGKQKEAPAKKPLVVGRIGSQNRWLNVGATKNNGLRAFQWTGLSRT